MAVAFPPARSPAKPGCSCGSITSVSQVKKFFLLKERLSVPLHLIGYVARDSQCFANATTDCRSRTEFFFFLSAARPSINGFPLMALVKQATAN